MRKSTFTSFLHDALEALSRKYDTRESLYNAFVAYLKSFPEKTAFYRLGNELPLDFIEYLETADAGIKGTFQIGMSRFAIKEYM